MVAFPFMTSRTLLFSALLCLSIGFSAAPASASGFIQTMQLHEKAMKARDAAVKLFCQENNEIFEHCDKPALAMAKEREAAKQKKAEEKEAAEATELAETKETPAVAEEASASEEANAKDESSESEEAVEEALENAEAEASTVPVSTPAEEPTVHDKFRKAFDLDGWELKN